jgi:hypothetical protein
MPTDEDLIDNLENIIDEYRKQRKNRHVAPELESVNLSANTVLELPGFSNLDSDRRDALRKKFQQILDRPTSRSTTRNNRLDQLQFQVKHGGTDADNHMGIPVDRRLFARQTDKEHDIARMYFIEHMKPAQIAKKVGLGASQVSRIVGNMKRNAKKIYKKMEEIVQPGVVPSNKLTFDEQVIATFNSLD